MDEKITYSAAGVDIDAAETAKRKIAEYAKSTFTEKVLTQIGLFAGAFDIGGGKVLLASTDGVGTKILVAIRAGIYNTVGVDLVHHCVNDILVHGAEPLFLLDYLAHTDLTPDRVAEVVRGLAEGCCDANCALIGGETAQMPGFYPSGVFDLAATIVGQVEKDKIITGEKIRAGDRIIALPANGLHTNGYSLARYVLFQKAGLDVDTRVDELGETVGEALLKVHPLYLEPVKKISAVAEIHGMAHITGGGVAGNLSRVLPKNVDAVVRKNSAPEIPIFQLIRRIGEIPEDEMFRAFNMGFGFLVIVPQDQTDRALAAVREHGAFIAGEIVPGEGKVILT